MPLGYLTAKRILLDYEIPKLSQVGSHEQYGLWEYKITLARHKEMKPGTAKSFLLQVEQVTNVTIKDLIKQYNIKL